MQVAGLGDATAVSAGDKMPQLNLSVSTDLQINPGTIVPISPVNVVPGYPVLFPVLPAIVARHPAPVVMMVMVMVVTKPCVTHDDCGAGFGSGRRQASHTHHAAKEENQTLFHKG